MVSCFLSTAHTDFLTEFLIVPQYKYICTASTLNTIIERFGQTWLCPYLNRCILLCFYSCVLSILLADSLVHRPLPPHPRPPEGPGDEAKWLTLLGGNLIMCEVHLVKRKSSSNSFSRQTEQICTVRFFDSTWAREVSRFLYYTVTHKSQWARGRGEYFWLTTWGSSQLNPSIQPS